MNAPLSYSHEPKTFNYANLKNTHTYKTNHNLGEQWQGLKREYPPIRKDQGVGGWLQWNILLRNCGTVSVIKSGAMNCSAWQVQLLPRLWWRNAFKWHIVQVLVGIIHRCHRQLYRESIEDSEEYLIGDFFFYFISLSLSWILNIH